MSIENDPQRPHDEAMNPAIRVIIAEDDPQIAEIQRRFLERIEGFTLAGIAHGLAEAQDLVEVIQPELLLLDVQFPTGTGLDLLRRLRATNCATDVILITAAKEVDTLRDALRAGVFDYILKPLVFERLQEALQNYAAHLQRLRNLQSLEQSHVDRLLPRSGNTGPQPGKERLPKGIDPLTLERVRSECVQSANPLSAEQVGERIGASRTTARRYLEHLVSCEELEASVSYGSVGRPERRYQRQSD
ncbi:response regulator [Aestuariirhabdus sp. Z084]|uniref:response regulator n=1 Tax=Aestuariirhabdus haliotis TaxID=2918751 RepID=UPI00201B359C|nr:response regulator [Aestuariirhabdus haliotis]MCL6414410.1 response regulator [Aestuariirhabdus haliotis]MCL6418342.1 response regulator [Aestuariirhabdus haliotis]